MAAKVAVRIGVAVLSSLTLLSGASVAAAAKAKPPIKIGEIAALTGPTALTGLQEQLGAKLAVAQINAKGGLLGRKVQLITLDFGGQVPNGVEDYRRLAADDHVSAVIGTNFSNVNIAFAPLTSTYKVPNLSDAIDLRATIQHNGKAYPYSFLAQPSATDWGVAMAKVALHVLKKKTVGILVNQDNAFATAQEGPFVSYFKRHGGKVVSIQQYPTTATQYQTYLTNIIAAQPQLLLLTDYGQQDGMQAQEARQLGFKGKILGPNTMSTASYTSVAGSYASGTWFVNNVDMRLPRFRAFNTAFYKMFDAPPATTNAVFGYDDVNLIADAIRAGRSATPASITKQLDRLVNQPVLEGAGTFTMSRKFHRPLYMPVTIFEWVNGKAVDKGPMSTNPNQK